MRKIFLETSFFSFLDEMDSSEKMADTVKIYEYLGNNNEIDAVSSQEVISEIAQCHEPKRSFMLRKMGRVYQRIIAVSDNIRDLAWEYQRIGVLPPKSIMDLTHAASAVLSDCSMILSWNMKHLANSRTIERLNKANYELQLPGIQILTPSRFLEDLNNE